MRDACKLLSFDAAACVQQLVGGWIAAIPTGWLLTAVFLAGLVLGAVLGWKRLIAVGAGILLYKLIFDRPQRAPADDIYPHPDKQRQKRFELPDLLGGLGRRRPSASPDFRDWIEGDD